MLTLRYVMRYVLPRYYGSRGKIIGRPGHYGDIIPLGLKVYFLLVVAMTARRPGAGATSRRAAALCRATRRKTTSRLTDEDYRFGT